MIAKSAALEMVAAVEGQGRLLLTKWTALARNPESYGQIRDFNAAIDEYSTFIDLAEEKIAQTKPDRMDEILNYLTQLRVQIFSRKVEILEQLFQGLAEAGKPLPLGTKSLFQGIRSWVQQVRRMNNIAIKELGSGPMDGDRIQSLDRLVKQAIDGTRDLTPLKAPKRATLLVKNQR